MGNMQYCELHYLNRVGYALRRAGGGADVALRTRPTGHCNGTYSGKLKIG